MALIRRQTLLPRTTDKRSPQIFIVATEGADTERKYFEAFNPAPATSAPFASLPIFVRVLPPLEHRSAPPHVLKQLRDFVAEVRLDPRDEVWLVMDVDQWEAHTLAKVCGAARRHRFHVAISNPCFEVWLCQHFLSCTDEAIAAATQSRQAGENLKHLWRAHLPPSTTQIERTYLRPQARTACERARASDAGNIGTQQPWPDVGATQVYVLVEKLLAMLEE